jgi:hypothetical protein
MMMVKLQTRMRDTGDEDKKDVEDRSGYQKSGVRLPRLGWKATFWLYYKPDRDLYLLYQS